MYTWYSIDGAQSTKHLLFRVAFVAEVYVDHRRGTPPGTERHGGVSLAGILAGAPRQPPPPPAASITAGIQERGEAQSGEKSNSSATPAAPTAVLLLFGLHLSAKIAAVSRLAERCVFF